MLTASRVFVTRFALFFLHQRCLKVLERVLRVFDRRQVGGRATATAKTVAANASLNLRAPLVYEEQRALLRIGQRGREQASRKVVRRRATTRKAAHVSRFKARLAPRRAAATGRSLLWPRQASDGNRANLPLNLSSTFASNTF